MEDRLLRQGVKPSGGHAEKKSSMGMERSIDSGYDDFYSKLGFTMGFLWWFK